MLDYDALFELPLFGLTQSEKERVYNEWLPALTEHHAVRCPEYGRLVSAFGDRFALPVRLFKELSLRSVDEGDVRKTMTSSGTTGQQKSMIYLDRSTSARQTKALARVVSDFSGTGKRMPMLVVDAPGTVKNRSMFSARTAGIRGFSMLGRDVTFALDDDMTLDMDAICSFVARHDGERVLVFGFTFMVWKYFVLPFEERGEHLCLDGILVHGGGWKKLAAEAVGHDEFNARVKDVCGNVDVCDYYGMVEQTGSIAMECACGHLHASLLSDIEVVDPFTLQVLPTGRRGLIKSMSLLPTSYPGHILLTEDEGTVLGVDDCPCGRKGKYFAVHGRLPGAEVRGCSDTYERR